MAGVDVDLVRDALAYIRAEHEGDSEAKRVILEEHRADPGRLVDAVARWFLGAVRQAGDDPTALLGGAFDEIRRHAAGEFPREDPRRGEC